MASVSCSCLEGYSGDGQQCDGALRCKLEMWANAQRDGRPAEYGWRPLFDAEVWLTPSTGIPCSNAGKTRNPLKLAGLPQTRQLLSAASGPEFTVL